MRSSLDGGAVGAAAGGLGKNATWYETVMTVVQWVIHPVLSTSACTSKIDACSVYVMRTACNSSSGPSCKIIRMKKETIHQGTAGRLRLHNDA